MTHKAISPLRRRLIEDMTIRRLSPKTHYQYIRHVKKFADFLGRSADKATAEDVRRYQLWLASLGTTAEKNVAEEALWAKKAARFLRRPETATHRRRGCSVGQQIPPYSRFARGAVSDPPRTRHR